MFFISSINNINPFILNQLNNYKIPIHCLDCELINKQLNNYMKKKKENNKMHDEIIIKKFVEL